MTPTLEIQTEDIAYMPRILARYNSPSSKPPVRAYIHESGFAEAFPSSCCTNSFYEAIKYLKRVLNPLKNGGLRTKTDFSYFLAMIWGADGDKIVDLVGILDIDSSEEPENWQIDLAMPTFVFRNGVYQPKLSYLSEDSHIILGQEGQYRRYCKNLQQYLQNPPELFGLKFE
jgi:hypothetical protein